MVRSDANTRRDQGRKGPLFPGPLEGWLHDGIAAHEANRVKPALQRTARQSIRWRSSVFRTTRLLGDAPAESATQIFQMRGE